MRQILAIGALGFIFLFWELSPADQSIINPTDSRLFFPHVVSDRSWETEIGVINADEIECLNGELIGFDQNGKIAGRITDIQLGPLSKVRFVLGSQFEDPAEIRYLVLQSDSQSATGYAKIFIEGKCRASVPAVRDSGKAKSVFISHIASGDDWETGIALVNTSDRNAAVTIDFNTGESVARSIVPGGYDFFLISEIFGKRKQKDIKTAEIKEAGGLLAVEFFINEKYNYLGGILLKDGSFSDIYFPHLASTLGWSTGIVAHNGSGQESNLKIRFHRSDGVGLTESSVRIGPGRRYFGDTAGLEIQPEASWMQIHSDQPISGLELFCRTNQLAGFNAVDMAATAGVFPEIEKNGDTGVALVNIQKDTVIVNLACYDSWGNKIGEASRILAPYEKDVRRVEDFFDSDISNGEHVTFQSAREIVGFQLNASSDGMMLDALPALKTDSQSGGAAIAEWTFMIYMSGDNNLSEEAVGDINEMETVGSTPEINLVAQVEFSPVFSPGLDDYNTLRGKITKDSDQNVISSPLQEIGQLDMGSKETLTDFISWAEKRHPAKRYALVLWDHGEGWKKQNASAAPVKGAMEDAAASSFMTLPDLADAVRSSGLYMDVINFDACLMAMYEVAYEFVGITDYMVFSEDVEPDDGDPYHLILQKLAARPEMSAENLAGLIAEEFRKFYQSLKTKVVTKSAVHIPETPSLHENLCALSRLMNEDMNTLRPLIQSARDESICFDFPENHDLGDFLKKLAEKTANDELLSKIGKAQSALEKMVIRNEFYSPAPETTGGNPSGLAIYIPRRDQAAALDLANYGLLAINKKRAGGDVTWGNFVNLLTTGDANFKMNPFEKVVGNFSIWLAWDSDADLDLLIREPDGNFWAPYHGVNSDNGFFSEDSSQSGESSEYYNAAEVVDPGPYEVYVNYFQDGDQKSAEACVYLMDPENGSSEYVILDSRTLDLSNPAPVFWMDDPELIENVRKDVYSDWWVPEEGSGALNRASGKDQNSPLAGPSSFTFPLKDRLVKPESAGD